MNLETEPQFPFDVILAITEGGPCPIDGSPMQFRAASPAGIKLVCSYHPAHWVRAQYNSEGVLVAQPGQGMSRIYQAFLELD